MDLELADKVAVVTGANKGIGFAVTQAFWPRAPSSWPVRGPLTTSMVSIA